ncbi:hypothetical protein [Bradyrhizobium sp. RD5-C2]|uniref:hypothetical protein n=1 Tax=Bradyrhizobium sp. RD5-C2 TaxID=244562 RepID=UPI001CC75F09|nr:hypothetical protein [Bradyrhizobium sp. RD5-C2]GIQ75430.1 hypothetical protein BraRD5C2_38710 [Bradyrhizobium sp. RD5-C2]
MALHFRRATADIEIWSASAQSYSFVISNESRIGLGLHGPPGVVASWSSLDLRRPAMRVGGRPAMRVGGSPFKTFAEAEKAYEALLKHLIQQG